ncbi:hypothetical protein QYM36_013240 [Artemia franciscana]|uniref:J domain-containing protein n=1 Tax=Artemia franciscana TaxID=6661 RepID=A0AA88HLZ6_ARTSF|nr:hypothetical protein QYM36_013240 [Artemia franciscana]
MRVFSILDEWLVVLIATTYIFRSQKTKKNPEKKIKECNCDGCQIKDGFLTKQRPSNILDSITQQLDHEYANFGPYNILGIDIGASNAEIKTAYKTKALVYHPEKETEDEILFINLTKAYKTHTDKTAKGNWQLHIDTTYFPLHDINLRKNVRKHKRKD